jgi:hypothetical protein
MKKFYRKDRTDSYSTNPSQLSPKAKVKLTPLNPQSFKLRDLNFVSNFPARSSLTKIIEDNSKEYESAIKQHLQIPLKSRESIEEDQSPLVKISTQSPKCFKLKVTSKSVTEEDLKVDGVKTELSYVTVDKISERKLNKIDLGSKVSQKFNNRIRGSIEEMRLFLAKIRN